MRKLILVTVFGDRRVRRLGGGVCRRHGLRAGIEAGRRFSLRPGGWGNASGHEPDRGGGAGRVPDSRLRRGRPQCAHPCRLARRFDLPQRRPEAPRCHAASGPLRRWTADQCGQQLLRRHVHAGLPVHPAAGPALETDQRQRVRLGLHRAILGAARRDEGWSEPLVHVRRLSALRPVPSRASAPEEDAARYERRRAGALGVDRHRSGRADWRASRRSSGTPGNMPTRPSRHMRWKGLSGTSCPMPPPRHAGATGSCCTP